MVLNFLQSYLSFPPLDKVICHKFEILLSWIRNHTLKRTAGSGSAKNECGPQPWYRGKASNAIINLKNSRDVPNRDLITVGTVPTSQLIPLPVNKFRGIYRCFGSGSA